jgi:hypothetical protein
VPAAGLISIINAHSAFLLDRLFAVRYGNSAGALLILGKSAQFNTPTISVPDWKISMDRYTMVEYAGLVSNEDLLRLTSLVFDAIQARWLAHLLSIAAGAEVSVRHVDELGQRHQFVVSPNDPMPDAASTTMGVVVSI